jgi:hypothetical protein
MAVTQLCDGTMCNGSGGPWKEMHCVDEPWRSGYCGSASWESPHCVMA